MESNDGIFFCVAHFCHARLQCEHLSFLKAHEKIHHSDCTPWRDLRFKKHLKHPDGLKHWRVTYDLCSLHDGSCTLYLLLAQLAWLLCDADSPWDSGGLRSRHRAWNGWVGQGFLQWAGNCFGVEEAGPPLDCDQGHCLENLEANQYSFVPLRKPSWREWQESLHSLWT